MRILGTSLAHRSVEWDLVMSHLCLFASLFLSCDAAPEAALVEGREATVLMQTIEAGLLEWRREVVFRSTYTFRMGMANSVESGLKGEF